MFKQIRWILLIYGLIAALFYGYQQYFFFQPKKLKAEASYQFENGLKYEQAKLPFDSATVIDVIRFLPDSIPRGVVLFFHGNRFNVKHYSHYANYFTRHGYECWMPDYPGYGRSSGEITIDLLHRITLQLYKMARAKYDKRDIVVYGKSLGTGLAAYLASVRDCKSVILETPYKSLSSLAGNYLFLMPTSYLVKYDIDTYTYIKDITAPITIIHGGKDEVIPLTNAIQLSNHMKPQDAFYLIPGGEHNTLPNFPLYQSIIDSVMEH